MADNTEEKVIVDAVEAPVIADAAVPAEKAPEKKSFQRGASRDPRLAGEAAGAGKKARKKNSPRGGPPRPPRRGGGRPGGRPRGNRPRDERRSEFAQKLIGIRRVARVMAGGRRFNFSAALVLGDKKGRVGV